MARLWQFLTDRRVLVATGVAALAAILVIGAEVLGAGMIWAAIAGLALLAGWGTWWAVRRWLRGRAAARLGEAIARGESGTDTGKDELAVLRKNLGEAISTIKTSTLGLTRGAAADYSALGVRVNAICPGAVDTPMLQEAIRTSPPPSSATGGRPIGRYGTAEEIAEGAVWLLSRASSYATGAALAVDGGYTCV